jgi:ATP/maltotriose-dependent transcriptional regulator MalT
MKEKTAAIAKITPPRIERTLSRPRLFTRLEQNNQKPIIFISAPAGSGKTTLIASYLDTYKYPCLWYQIDESDADPATFFYYLGLAAQKVIPTKKMKSLPLLTPEYLPGLPVFTRRYFEKLYTALTPPFFLVFDNYQEIPFDSPFHELLRIGLEIIPEGIKVVLISRTEPPPVLQIFQANNRMELICAAELCLTLDEMEEFMHLRQKTDLNQIALTKLHEFTRGWIAGTILMLKISTPDNIETEFARDLMPETISDYFAVELFKRMEETTRDFLLKTALFPSMTVKMAEKLTGVKMPAKF